MNKNSGCIFFPIMLIFQIFAFLVVGDIIDSQTKKIEYYESENIYSIKDSNDINTTFAIGSGVIETETVYRFFTKEDGYLKPSSVSGENIRILKDSKQHPKIKYLYEATVPKDFDENSSIEEIKSANTSLLNVEPKLIILVIPEDAIELDYRLDSH